MPRSPIDPSTSIIRAFLKLPTAEGGMLLKLLSAQYEARLLAESTTTTAAAPRVVKPRAPKAVKPVAVKAAAPVPATFAPENPAGQVSGPRRRGIANATTAAGVAAIANDAPAQGHD